MKKLKLSQRLKRLSQPIEVFTHFNNKMSITIDPTIMKEIEELEEKAANWDIFMKLGINTYLMKGCADIHNDFQIGNLGLSQHWFGNTVSEVYNNYIKSPPV
jgi:hypothetical protein